MESEDRKPIFTKRLILTILAIILIILIILLLLKRCGKGGDTEITQILVSPTTVNLEPGGTYPVYAEINTSATIYWMTSDDTCVTVSPTEGTSVVFTAGNKECTAIVTAHSGSTKTEIPVTVTKTLDKLEGLQLSKSNYTVYVGKSTLASVTAVPTTAQLPELVYRIEDTSIATVNENGVIKGVSVGTTTLIVTTIDGSLSVTAKVTVQRKSGGSQEPVDPTPVPVSSIEFNSSNDKEVCVGKQIILGYVIKPDNATNKGVIWSVNNPTDKEGLVNAYSSVDANGYVTGIAAGTTKVTITSKENSKLVATSTITVLASSNSKCKSSGGSHSSGGSGGTGTKTGEITTSTGTNGGMSCTVTALAGENGWYKSLTINWKYTPTPGLWDDGNYNRQWCKDAECNPMPGSSYYYTPEETKQLPKFWYKYTNKNGDNVIVEEAKSGSCSLANTKLDTKNPECQITSKLNNGSVEITITGNDNMSGIARLGLNGSYQTFAGGYESSYTIKRAVSDSTVSFSGIVYDKAGRSGVCSTKVNLQTGTSEERVYAKKINLHLDKTTLLRGQTASGYAWLAMSDGSSVAASNITVSGGTISQSGNRITFTPDATSTKGLVTVTAVGIDGDKPLTASVSVNITDVASQPKVSMNVSCTRGNNGWCKSEATVGISVELDPDSNDKVKSAKVCAGSSCTPSSSTVKVKTSGTEFINYSLTTEKLGAYVTRNLLGTVKVDVSAPSCTVTKSGEGAYYVVFQDTGSGLAGYSFNGTSKSLPSGYASSPLTLRSSEATVGKTITVTDVAGNSGSCQITDTKLVLKHLNFGAANPVTLIGGQTKSVTVYYAGEGNTSLIDSNVKGITVSSTNTSCFSASGLTGIVSITAAQAKPTADCSGQVVVTSTYDSSVKGYITVNVKKYVAPSLNLSTSSITLERSGSKTVQATLDPKYPARWSVSGGNASCFTVSINGNGYATIALKPSVTASCNGTFKINATVDSETYSKDVNVSYTAATISISKTSGNTFLEHGGTAAVRATITGGDGTVTWRNTNANCISARGSGDKTAIVTAKNDTAIQCRGGVYATAVVRGETISSNVISFVVNPRVRPTLSVSGPSRLGTATAVATYSVTATNTSGIATYSWRSSDSSCATIGGSRTGATLTGRNTSTSDCTTSITLYGYDMNGNIVATSNSLSVTVAGTTSGAGIRLSLSGPNSLPSATGTITLSATSSGTIGSVTYSWTSSNTSCATVGGSGTSATVTGRNTASSSCTANITVSLKDSTGVTLKSAIKVITVPALGYSCRMTWNKVTQTITITGSGAGGEAPTRTIIDGKDTSSLSPTVARSYSGTAYFNGGKTASCSVTVPAADLKPWPACSITAPASSLTSITLTATLSSVGTGIAAYEAGWTGSGSTYRRTVTSGGTYRFTAKDSAGRQTTCSIKINEKVQYQMVGCKAYEYGAATISSGLSSCSPSGTAGSSYTYSTCSSVQTKTRQSCSTGTYSSSPTVSWVSSCSARSQSDANRYNMTSYITCYQNTAAAEAANHQCASHGLTAPCYEKRVYNRTGCSTWGAIENITSCMNRVDIQYKYVCTTKYNKSSYTANKCNLWSTPIAANWSDSRPPSTGCTSVTCNTLTRTQLSKTP